MKMNSHVYREYHEPSASQSLSETHTNSASHSKRVNQTNGASQKMSETQSRCALSRKDNPMTKSLTVYADIGDWDEEAHRKELIPESKEDIVKAVRVGNSTAEIARATVVSRERGHAPLDIIRPIKMLIQVGAQLDIISIMHQQRITGKTEKGKEYNIPEFVGVVAEKLVAGEEDLPDDEQSHETSYVTSESAEGLQRAMDYLERVIPGHIRNRLYIIHHDGGDVRNEADKLKEAVDELVNELMD
jgi:hypothetical protein